MRVVSLACSNTEILWALGCLDSLIAVDDHSDFPPEALKGLPRVGPDLDIDIAKVAALKPDLVLATLTVPGHERIVEGLEKAGLPYIAPEPVGLNDIYENIRTIAAWLEAPKRGERVVAEMKEALRPAPPLAEPPSILVQWWPRPVIAPTGESWVNDLFHLAGARNPLEADSGKSRPLGDEEVARLDPDAVVLSWCGVNPAKYRPDVVYGNPLWQDVRALRYRRVFSIPEAYLGRPGPRLVEGYKALRRIVAACA